jgi:hypothetical protein
MASSEIKKRVRRESVSVIEIQYSDSLPFYSSLNIRKLLILLSLYS